MKIDLGKAVNLLISGEVVAIPTETVYGLAADTFNAEAVKKIFRLKGRPADNPLIVHICNTNQIEELSSDIPDTFLKLAENFWPGPLSMILKKRSKVPDIVTGGLKTVAIRMPDNPLALSVIEQTGPLTAPSANRSGRPSPTRPSHIEDDFGDAVPVLDGGYSRLGLESTVLDLTVEPHEILRPGYISAEQISDAIGKKIKKAPPKRNKTRKSPGTRYTHYKPKAAVNWMDKKPQEIRTPENYYIFHSKEIEEIDDIFIHSYKNDIEKLARELYDHFRTADHLSCQHIFIESLGSDSDHPLNSALRDRINRAAGIS